MLISRPPQAALRPFLKSLWISNERTSPGGSGRELVLPTGGMHLVFRLDHPLHLYDGLDDRRGRTVGHAVVGGARAAFYTRDISRPTRSVGAQLHPGAAELLLGVPAGELAQRHTPLGDLWGSAAGEVHQRLLEAEQPQRQLDLFESVLGARLPRVRGVHPAVAHALSRFAVTSDIGEIVNQCGCSHRRFIALFHHAVGLTPKLYCRVLRFQDALGRVAAMPAASRAQSACAAGYSDQPHFNREFREFAGLSPGEYRKLSPAQAHHVPLPGAVEKQR